MGEGNIADVMYEGMESNGVICMNVLSNHMLLKVNVMLQIRYSCMLGRSWAQSQEWWSIPWRGVFLGPHQWW